MKDSGSKAVNLEAPEVLDFQRKSWRIQRIGWVVMGLLLLLTVLGALGEGPLTRATTRSADSTVVARYQRVWRMESPTVLEVTATPDGHGTLDLTLDGGFLGAVSLSDMQPLPQEIIALPDGQRLHYRAEGRAPVALRFRATPHRFGRLRARLTGPKAQSIELSLFVLP